MKVVERGDHFGGSFGFQWVDQNCIRVVIVHDHEVFVSSDRRRRECTGLVGKNVSGRCFHRDKAFVTSSPRIVVDVGVVVAEVFGISRHHIFIASHALLVHVALFHGNGLGCMLA